MNLTEEQKKKLTGWIEEGLKLSEIQTKVQKEFGITLTYMEARFLMADLKLQPKDKPEPTPTPPPAPAPKAISPQPAPGQPAQALPPEDAADLPLPSNVSVSVDQVSRPGAMVSGKVTWSDGKKSEWYLDQMGRLGLVSPEQGYKPSQEDIYAFQEDLQAQLAKLGY